MPDCRGFAAEEGAVSVMIDALEDVAGRLLEFFMPLSVILLVVAAVIGIPAALYFEYKAEKFYLRKDEWTCIQSHKESVTTYVKSGEVMVPIATWHDVCDIYGRNGRKD